MAWCTYTVHACSHAPPQLLWDDQTLARPLFHVAWEAHWHWQSTHEQEKKFINIHRYAFVRACFAEIDNWYTNENSVSCPFDPFWPGYPRGLAEQWILLHIVSAHFRCYRQIIQVRIFFFSWDGLLEAGVCLVSLDKSLGPLCFFEKKRYYLPPTFFQGS